LVPGAAVPAELDVEVVVAAASVAEVVVELDAVGAAAFAEPDAAALAEPDDELLPPQAATPPASANAASAAPIDVPRSVPIIITPWIKLSDKLTSQDAQSKENAPRDAHVYRFVSMRVLVLDNYDSFTYNLVQYLGELGAAVEVVRNDHASVDELLVRGYDRVVVSPGPCTPNEAGISLEAVRRFPQAKVPTLGVCLGHQALVQAWGGRVIQHEPVHGKTTVIDHDAQTIFRGLRRPLEVGRYHSLVVDPDLPDCFQASAHGGEVVMAVRHRELPAEGVQFHPESVLTEQGRELLANFLARTR
jgi:anthranilate synthase/aminodeoxychorismate synthase-like glutamine amidotransferase